MITKLGTTDITKSYLGATPIYQKYLGGEAPVVDFHTNAVDFDGSSEYMLKSSGVSVSLGACTISTWIDGNAFSGSTYVMSMRNSSNQNVLYVRFISSKFYALFGVGGSSGVLNPNVYPSAGVKYNIVIKSDGVGNAEMLVDGVSIKTATGSSFSGTATKISIGGSTAGSGYFDGVVSRVDYWDTDLSNTEIVALYDSGEGYKKDLRDSLGDYTSTSNLKHQWVLGKDTGTNIGADYVSSGNLNLSDNSVNVTDADIVTF